MSRLMVDSNVDVGSLAQYREMSNDGIIIQLIQTLNHLSRWLTPIHDRAALEYSERRASSSVKDLLISLRDTEASAYSLMNAIATVSNPDLDRVPRVSLSSTREQADRQSNALVVMSEFRRTRESSTSLLRALPDNAWERGGFSRTERNWTIRELAEFLAANDRRMLRAIDEALAASGLREGIAVVSQIGLDQINQPFLGALHRN